MFFLFAIGMHIQRLVYNAPSGHPNHETRVVEDSGNSNTSGGPLLDDYLLAEAGDNYLPIPDDSRSRVITVNMSDVNNA